MRPNLQTIHTILQRYDFPETVILTESYLDQVKEPDWVKLIFAVTLSGGKKLVIKILHGNEPSADGKIIEAQCRFSEAMRAGGILTPRRYLSGASYCTPLSCCGLPCWVTVEDYCGQEIRCITPALAGEIGGLMARMHLLSLENRLSIGCGTLFSAAWDNDVDAYDRFCELCRTDGIRQELFEHITTLRTEKLSRIRALWPELPKCAVQGDISINNLVWDDSGLQVFDYNNAGDEVLVGDMVLEGLLTAFEMDLPAGVPESSREMLLDAFFRGYLSLRPLTQVELEVVWDIYTLWHGLWFTRIVYREDSLEKRLLRHDLDGANGLLEDILRDMCRPDDLRFHVSSC